MERKKSIGTSQEIRSLSHHQRMVEVWSHKRYQAKYIWETFGLFLWPMKPIMPWETMVDVGSGVGLRVASLRKLGYQAWGLELDPRVVGMTVKEAGGFNERGSLLNRFDLERHQPKYIISDDVLEHLLPRSIIEFLRLARLVGVTKMVHSVTTLEHKQDIHNDPTHVTKLWAREWREFLNREGWKVVGNSAKMGRFGVFSLVRDQQTSFVPVSWRPSFKTA